MERVSVLGCPLSNLKGIKMITLNLTANNDAEQRIKDYLEQNVSETLADKINNGVQITKDNLTLINKKDLSGFMKYANDEARKQSEKGAQYACVDDATVFGWAIHYFEEDSIEGKLFNQDNTEYKPKSTHIEKFYTPKEEPKPQDQQESLFDILDGPFNVPVTFPNYNRFEPKVENTVSRDIEKFYTPKVETKTEPKQDNKYLSILNEILGGIVKEY